MPYPDAVIDADTTPSSCGASAWFGPWAASAIAPNSGDCSRTHVAPDHLRWLSEGAQEGAAHAVAIGETRLPGDDVDRMAALLHQQPGGLDAQFLDRLGRRLASLGAEGTAELARA